GQTSDQVNTENVYAEPGPYTVTLTASNAAGCNNTLSKPLIIYSKPEVDFTALAPPFSCSGTPTQFNDLTPPPPDSNLSLWQWNFGDAGSPSNTATQRNPQHTYATAGDYTVNLTVTTNFSCSETFQKTVTIHQTPTAAFTHSPLCEDLEVTFSDAASANHAWNWQIGSDFYFTESPVHVFNNPGNYNVALSVTGTNNCIGSTAGTVVIPNKLNVDFSSLKNCVNQQTVFTDLTNDTSDPVTGVNWNFGVLGSATTNPATFRFPETGVVNVTLTVTTQSGCVFPFTKPVDIKQGPLASFTANPNTGEAPLNVQFINTSLNANTYNWKFDAAGASATQPSSAFIYLDEGNYTAELVATDLNNCTDTTQQLIEVLAPSELRPPSPNPGNGVFTIEWKPPVQTQTSIVLVDALGREIRNFEVLATAGLNRYILNIVDEQPGFYMLRIGYLNTVKTYRLVVSE
ncbi:MAG TPA: PKD domain-containing protein, partial [Cyclobacteriaceae bacterium]|nr:PKD domain-containing protein [Cyclobacteriaceae bacterium]